MAMKVEIFSRETIKPSSPTPESLRTFKLSRLDQLTPPVYVPIILFFSTTISSTESQKRSDHLKESLSKTLTHLYPLAGRVKNDLSIECSDQGVDFVQARVAENMSKVLKHPKMDLLQQLLPHGPLATSGEPSDLVILGVQINHFACGGTAIGVSIQHVIADGLTVATLIKKWANIAADKVVDDGNNFIFDCTAIFPPRDAPRFPTISGTHDHETPEIVLPKSETKKIVFDGSKIAALKRKAACLKRPSRVEVVSALIWAGVITAARERNEGFKLHRMWTAVDLRKRMDPPLPPHSIGNIYHSTEAVWLATEKTIDFGALVKRVRDSIQKVTGGEYVRKKVDDHQDDDDEYSNSIPTNEMEYLFTSSWCRFGLYEVDFGWPGKPIWVANCMRFPNLAIFMDTSDGEGIEAWVGLSEEDMRSLEQNLDLMAYVSSYQSV